MIVTEVGKIIESTGLGEILRVIVFKTQHDYNVVS